MITKDIQDFNVPAGGFVIHGSIGGRRVSAWYDRDGNLTDCEKIDASGRSRKPSRGDIEDLRAAGKRRMAPSKV